MFFDPIDLKSTWGLYDYTIDALNILMMITFRSLEFSPLRVSRVMGRQ